MKRVVYVIIGIMIGVLISFGIGASGGRLDSLIGKGIQGEREMYLNGEKIGTAVIIDGQTFMPVRAMDGYFGVNFTLDSRKIVFSQNNTFHGERPKKFSLYQIQYMLNDAKEQLSGMLMEQNKQPLFYSLAQKKRIAVSKLLIAQYELWETDYMLDNP
ncbi:hypothetical protein PAECIP111893_00479 [Paenibacillus plantiphilus]|uniref:Copper amine oxidase-like N-terminal domain-containing protein n=1 Tax=Paenibacillus plantiphilus TaxID=2905650 RepID=A0ABM9BSA0_9BACL|nr:hypothetical protein [Paenibacillus plantiphilus]CAH1193503.1 hypothetical protein PAECIP111893_00479 [Paenibacillus plantiphilus]